MNALGARVSVEGRSAVVQGPSRLQGCTVDIPDIRSGAALVIAALAAEGESVLSGVYHLDRGYEDLDEKLTALGATVARVKMASGEPSMRDLSRVVGD